MKTRAAVAWKSGAPLSIETVDLEGPRAGEVLVEIKATGICHTDYYTLSGADPEGIFPATAALVFMLACSLGLQQLRPTRGAHARASAAHPASGPTGRCRRAR